MSRAVKRSKYIRELGQIRVGDGYKHRHYLSQSTALTLDRTEVDLLDAMLRNYFAVARVVLPNSYPKTFAKLSNDDFIFVQNVPDPERPGYDVIVYLILDLKAALSNTIGLFATSTRVKDIRVEAEGANEEAAAA